MQIALVSYEFPPANATGGIGSYMYHLAKMLTRSGNNVTVFSANPAADNVAIVQLDYCTNYLVPAVDNETFREAVVPVFTAFIQHNNLDVMECPEVGACALHIKEKFPGIPLVVKMHSPGVLITKVTNTYTARINKIRFVAGALLKGKIDLGYWATYDKNRDTDTEYQVCLLADRILSPTAALKEWAVSFWRIPAARIQIVPNPFSLQDELFNLPLANRPLVISFVGKLSVLKGMKAFTKAIPLIVKKNPGVKIFLVGRDELENGKSMRAYMQQQLAGYETNLVFTGAIDKEALREVYAQSRVCVFPSLWENYPTVVLEAMAAGAAVAASDVGGIPEIIAHRSLGSLFNPADPKQLAAAVSKLLQDDTTRLTMAAAARKQLLENLMDSGLEKKILNVYSPFENTKR